MMSKGNCPVICWVIAAVLGVLAGYIVGGLLGFWTLVAIIVALVVFVIAGLRLPTLICGEAQSAVAQPSVAARPTPSGETGAPNPAPKAVSRPEPAPAPVGPTAAVADATRHWSDAVPADSGKASAARGQTGLKPSAALAEEATLRDSVGAWKYGPDVTPDKVDITSESPIDPVFGAKPATLTEAREGKADDLKKIKGVGPKMEETLNGLGFYHFDQIAAWTAEELAWVDDSLDGFKGRASRDNWVEQAKLLATGGETEFS